MASVETREESTLAYGVGDGLEWYCILCAQERDPDNERSWKVCAFSGETEARVCAGGCGSFVEGDRAA